LRLDSLQPVLAIYNLDADTTVAADVLSIDIGTVLTQKQQNDQWLPIAYALRAFDTN